MSQHKNECIFIGRVTGSKLMPDGFVYRNLNGGNALLRFSLACNEQYKAADGSMKTVTMYIDCSAFGRLADETRDKLRSGDTVEAVTRYRKRSYVDKNNCKQTAHEFIAEHITLLSSETSNQGQQQPVQQAPPPPPPQQQQHQQRAPQEQRQQYSRQPAQQTYQRAPQNNVHDNPTPSNSNRNSYQPKPQPQPRAYSKPQQRPPQNSNPPDEVTGAGNEDMDGEIPF